MEDIIVVVSVVGLGSALMYPFLLGDFDDHPIWNLAYVIPAFYTWPLSLIATGLSVPNIFVTILGIIQLIIHIGIVIYGYDDLFISKITIFIITALATIIRVCSILLFVTIAQMLIEIIPQTDISMLKSIFDYLN